jgi:hypothetical protein
MEQTACLKATWGCGLGKSAWKEAKLLVSLYPNVNVYLTENSRKTHVKCIVLRNHHSPAKPDKYAHLCYIFMFSKALENICRAPSYSCVTLS